ncbi:hypothetical protein V6N13_076545 [Hibiscus sabdariffa]
MTAATKSEYAAPMLCTCFLSITGGRFVIHKSVEATIPEIEAMLLAHYLTIGSQCTASVCYVPDSNADNISLST